jgi:hypothetical protein
MKLPLAVLSSLWLAGACSQLPVDSTREKPEAPTLASPDFVARAIAMAMEEDGVRIAIRNHMRASPVSEHKLVLQDYVAGPLGEPLLEAIDRAGIGRVEFRRRLATLPSIQFYVPVRQQRLTWTGTPDVIVSANLGDAAPDYGYASRGHTVRFRLDGEVPGQVLFLLQRAEPMHRRVRSQGSTPGNVIQDRNDHDFGGARTYRDAAGRIMRTEELADIRPIFLDCGPEVFFCDVETGGGGGPPPGGLLLTRLVNFGVCDNACIFETLEFEFRTRSQFNSSWYISTQLTGIGRDQYDLNMYISEYRPVGQWVDVSVWETDSWPNEDDPFVCHWNFTTCPTALPRVQVAPSGSMAFGLCEVLGTACANAPWDLHVTFRDRP